MPRPTLAQELDQLAVLIHNAGPAGIGSDALLQQLGGTHERRTLQRRRNSTWHALGYDTTVRAETPADYEAIASLTRSAFNNEAEVRLITALRQQATDCIALVAEQHGQLVGHILFSAATLDKAPQTQLMALAPMAVSNVLQHQGIGSALVRAGLEQCKKQ